MSMQLFSPSALGCDYLRFIYLQVSSENPTPTAMSRLFARSLISKQPLHKTGRLFSSVNKNVANNNLSVALEWTPNTNHIGFFVARANGYYKENNLNVELISPDIDGYKQTPGRRAISGNADFAMGPTETAISSATTEIDKMRLISVATLLQKSTSAIVTLKSSKIDNINDIKTYASYDGRFEMGIIHEMIRKNKGNPENLEEIIPQKLEIWPSLMNNIVDPDGLKADSTWIFLQWEGVEAKLNNIDLNIFKLEDYDIPYGYSPLLLCRQDVLQQNRDNVKQFINATKKGYEYAADINNLNECTDILISDSGNHKSIINKRELVYESLKYLIENECYLDSNKEWGKMDINVWNKYLDWICDKEIIKKRDGTIVKRNQLKVEDLVDTDCI